MRPNPLPLNAALMLAALPEKDAVGAAKLLIAAGLDRPQYLNDGSATDRLVAQARRAFDLAYAGGAS